MARTYSTPKFHKCTLLERQLPAFIYFATFTSAKDCRARTGKMSAPAGLKKYQEIDKIQSELKAMESLGDNDHEVLGKGLVVSFERFIIAMSKRNKEYVSKYKDHKDDY